MMTPRLVHDPISPMIRIALIACLAALVLSGCGGSSKSSTPPTTTAVTSTAAPGAPLSMADWNTYVKQRDTARAINEAATKTFALCRPLLVSSASKEKVQSCLKDSTTSVVNAGKAALTELDLLKGKAGSECEAANAALTNYVKLYTASVQSLSVSVDRGDYASAQTSIANGLTALTHSRAAGVAFEKACKPTA